MRAQSKKVLGIHGGLILAELICVSAFVLELHRALGGNQLSWAYVFEWPILGLYGVYVWRKLLQEERGEPASSSPETPVNQEEEDARAEYNDYLRRVHQGDAHDEEPPS